MGINIPRFVPSVLLPMKVNKLPVRRKPVPTCFHVSFLCQAWSRCSEPKVVIIQSGTISIGYKSNIVNIESNVSHLLLVSSQYWM